MSKHEAEKRLELYQFLKRSTRPQQLALFRKVYFWFMAETAYLVTKDLLGETAAHGLIKLVARRVLNDAWRKIMQGECGMALETFLQKACQYLLDIDYLDRFYKVRLRLPNERGIFEKFNLRKHYATRTDVIPQKEEENKAGQSGCNDGNHPDGIQGVGERGEVNDKGTGESPSDHL